MIVPKVEVDLVPFRPIPLGGEIEPNPLLMEEINLLLILEEYKGDGFNVRSPSNMDVMLLCYSASSASNIILSTLAHFQS